METIFWIKLMAIFLAPLAGGFIAWQVRHWTQRYFPIALSFSGSFLLSIVLLHVLPTLFRQEPHAGYFVFAGFLLQIILEQLTRGLEHGHLHFPLHGRVTLPALLIGLSVHSFMDGLPVVPTDEIQETHTKLFYGIALHKIPEGYALATVLLAAALRWGRFLTYLLLFACTAPIAMMFGHYLAENHALIFFGLVSIAVGSFLHVTTTILLESGVPAHVFPWQRMVALLCGAALALTLG